MSAVKYSDCRFCGERGTVEWLGSHACPSDPMSRSNAVADRLLDAASVARLRMKLDQPRTKQGGIHLSFRDAWRILGMIERHGLENESPALFGEGLSGAGSTVQQAGDANSEGSKSSACSPPKQKDCAACGAAQGEGSE